MIDIHNHIIYDVDDGSQSIEQSLKMLKTAKDVGYNEICFTPHYMEDGYKTDKEVLIFKVDKIKELLDKEKLDIRLYLGEEVFIFPDLAQNFDKIVSMNDSKYILMEFPLVEEISYIDDVIYKILAYGKVPIIAHPERYMASSKDFSFVQNLLKKGALLQMNFNSLIGHYGKEAKDLAIKLLKNDMVQFIGTDAHSSAGYHSILQSMEVLRKLVSDEKIKELTEINPKKVLLNEEINIDLQKIFDVETSKKKSWLLSVFNRKVG